MVVTITAVMLTATVAKAGEIAPAAAPLASVNRLARMYAAPAPGDTPVQTAQRDRLAALVQYVNRVDTRQRAGNFRDEEWFNALQVVRDVVDAGVALSPSAEESLTWRRVGLDLSLSHYRFTAARGGPSPQIDQARAQIELMRGQYAVALARCAPR